MKKIVKILLRIMIYIPALAFASPPPSPPGHLIGMCHDKDCIATGIVADPDHGYFDANFATYISHTNKRTWKIYPTDEWYNALHYNGNYQNLTCDQNLQHCILTGYQIVSTIPFPRMKSTDNGGMTWDQPLPDYYSALGCMMATGGGASLGQIACSETLKNCIIVIRCRTSFTTGVSSTIVSSDKGGSWHFSNFAGPLPERLESLTCDKDVKICRTAEGYATYDSGENWQKE